MVTGFDEGSPGDKTKIMSMQEGGGDITTNDYRFTVEKRGRATTTPGAVTFRIINGDGGRRGLHQRRHPRRPSPSATSAGTSGRLTWGPDFAERRGPRGLARPGRVIYSSRGEHQRPRLPPAAARDPPRRAGRPRRPDRREHPGHDLQERLGRRPASAADPSRELVRSSPSGSRRDTGYNQLTPCPPTPSGCSTSRRRPRASPATSSIPSSARRSTPIRPTVLIYNCTWVCDAKCTMCNNWKWGDRKSDMTLDAARAGHGQPVLGRGREPEHLRRRADDASRSARDGRDVPAAPSPPAQDRHQHDRPDAGARDPDADAHREVLRREGSADQHPRVARRHRRRPQPGPRREERLRQGVEDDRSDAGAGRRSTRTSSSASPRRSSPRTSRTPRTS